jgi:hypothetical protein
MTKLSFNPVVSNFNSPPALAGTPRVAAETPAAGERGAVSDVYTAGGGGAPSLATGAGIEGSVFGGAFRAERGPGIQMESNPLPDPGPDPEPNPGPEPLPEPTPMPAPEPAPEPPPEPEMPDLRPLQHNPEGDDTQPFDRSAPDRCGTTGNGPIIVDDKNS